MCTELNQKRQDTCFLHCGTAVRLMSCPAIDQDKSVGYRKKKSHVRLDGPKRKVQKLQNKKRKLIKYSKSPHVHAVVR